MKSKTFVLLAKGEAEASYKVIGKPSKNFEKLEEQRKALSMKNQTTDYIISHK